MINALNKFSRNVAVPEIRIEKMEPGDVEEILTIESVSFPTPWSRNLFLQELKNPLARSLVAKIRNADCDEIAGYINYWIVMDEVHLQHIATRTDLRRSGIASLLCREMMNRAWKEGASHIVLEVRRSNAGAIAFYKRFAFEVKGIRPGYYDDTHEDALIMWVDVTRTRNPLNDAAK
ncbi:MAG: ribosomal protein S18-alanine N-acetyltransferase [Deltaproteobacteria bacterium]|nr:ribosomal protein S18-alanine N-acetyltransferase [Deltaproteobacteria bacterium]